LTPYVIAINESCDCRKQPGFNECSVVDQYRLYYQYDKPFATWTTRNQPDWYFSG
jgi:hypothetical protein